MVAPSFYSNLLVNSYVSFVHRMENEDTNFNLTFDDHLPSTPPPYTRLSGKKTKYKKSKKEEAFAQVFLQTIDQDVVQSFTYRCFLFDDHGSVFHELRQRVRLACPAGGPIFRFPSHKNSRPNSDNVSLQFSNQNSRFQHY